MKNALCPPTGGPFFQEGHTMFRAWAELIQHFVMQLCTVALVPCKLILRVLLIQHVDDIAVTADLGQDGGFRKKSENQSKCQP